MGDVRDLNAALVGFGFAGRGFHAPLIEACAGLNLHTIVSTQPAAAAAYPRARVCSLKEALADPAVELVVIATPNDTHAAMARQALAAGKAAVVDKPFTITLADAETLTAMAGQAGRLLSVFHNRRWDADFLAVKALVQSGRLGRVARFESHFDRFRPEVRDRWREEDVPGAGVWYDLGPHLIDQALQLFGLPEAVWCDLAVQREGGRAHDYAHAVLRYPRLRVVLHADTLSPAHDLRFAVHGDQGSFLKDCMDVQEAQLASGTRPGDPGWGADPHPGVVIDGAGVRTTFEGPPGDYRRYYDGIAAALRGDGANPVPPAEAVAVMRVLEAGLRSSETRAEVPL